MKENCLVVFTENKDHYNMEKQLATFKEDADIYRFSAEESYENLMKMAKNAEAMGYKNFYYLSESDDWQELDFDLQKELKGKFYESGVIKGNFRRLREDANNGVKTDANKKPVETKVRVIVWPDTIPAFKNDEYDTTDLQTILNEKSKIDANEKSFYKVFFPQVGNSTRGSLGTQNLYELAMKALVSSPNQEVKKMINDLGVDMKGQNNIEAVNFYDTGSLSQKLQGVSEVIATKSTKQILQSFANNGTTLRTVPDINDDSTATVQQKIDSVMNFIKTGITPPADIDTSLTEDMFTPKSTDKALDRYSKDFAQQIFINYIDNRNGIIYSSINTNVFVNINNNYTTYNTVTGVAKSIFDDAGNERVLSDTPFAAMYKAGKHAARLGFDKEYQKQMWANAAQATAHLGNGDMSANFAKRANDIDLAGKRKAELVKAKTNFNQRQDQLYDFLNRYCGLDKKQFDELIDAQYSDENFVPHFIEKYRNYIEPYGLNASSDEQLLKLLFNNVVYVNRGYYKKVQNSEKVQDTFSTEVKKTWKELYAEEKALWDKYKKDKHKTSSGAKIGELINSISMGKMTPTSGLLGELAAKIAETEEKYNKETDSSRKQLIRKYLDDAEKEYDNELNNFRSLAKEYMLNRNYQDYKINKSAINSADNIESNKREDTSMQGQLAKLNKLADQDKKKLKSIMQGKGTKGASFLQTIKQILSK